MCGRYSLFTEEENQEIMRIVKALDARYPGNTMKHGEVYPTNAAPILCLEREELKPELSTWGFPRFGTAKGVIINARSESADERPMFKKSLHTRRCAVPTTGFYEWTQSTQRQNTSSISPMNQLFIWLAFTTNLKMKTDL